MSTPVEMSGGAALAEMLRAHAVGTLFGMGGFQLLPFYERLRTLGLSHHLVNDERAGAFAADSYARITGRPGVCDGTLGPGATNLVTGLIESLNAGLPVIAITGNANRAHAGKHMTQEAQQTEILRPAVKALIRIEDGLRIPELVRRAFGVATAGRPGPVVIDVPEDVAHGTFKYGPSEFWADPASTQVPSRRFTSAAKDLGEAVDLIKDSSRPIILAGGGIHLSSAYDALRALAERQGIPVAYTMSGKGALEDGHALNVGVFGRYSRIANELIERSDCVIVVGSKLGEVATKRYVLPPAAAKLIHIDILPEEIAHWAPTTVGLCGDARLVLEQLLGVVPAADRATYRREVARLRSEWAAEASHRYLSDQEPIHMARLLGEMNMWLPPDVILVADGGFAAHWAALLFNIRAPGRGFVADRGFASIGYGIPAAVGAKLAAPDRQVVALSGDGGTNMMLGELETALRLKLNITLVVINNAASGYVKALQHAMYGLGSYQSSDLAELDYAAVARAMGCRGIRVTKPTELAPVLRGTAEGGSVPLVIDVVVTRDPASMLPGLDSRTGPTRSGDRPA